MTYRYVALKRNGKRIDEHRLIAGCKDAGYNVIVHHKDGDKRNNDPSNLEIMTRIEHAKHHGFGSDVNSVEFIEPDENGMFKCRGCGKLVRFEDLPPAKWARHGKNAKCYECKARWNRERRAFLKQQKTAPQA